MSPEEVKAATDAAADAAERALCAASELSAPVPVAARDATLRRAIR